MAGLDTAYVGTIHSFADRLLRLRPVAGRAEPVLRDRRRPRRARGRDGRRAPARRAERHARRRARRHAGRGPRRRGDPHDPVRARRPASWPASRETRVLRPARPRQPRRGIHRRSGTCPRPTSPPAPSMSTPFGPRPTSSSRLGAPSHGPVRRSALAPAHRRGASARVRDFADPWLILRELRPQLDRVPRNVTKGDHLRGRRRRVGRSGRRSPRAARRDRRPLRDDLCGPLDRWLATRLVRLFPVVVALYEKVKTRHRQLDQLDLLIKLRDLVAGRSRRARASSSACSTTSSSTSSRTPIRSRPRSSSSSASARPWPSAGTRWCSAQAR